MAKSSFGNLISVKNGRENIMIGLSASQIYEKESSLIWARELDFINMIRRRRFIRKMNRTKFSILPFAHFDFVNFVKNRKA